MLYLPNSPNILKDFRFVVFISLITRGMYCLFIVCTSFCKYSSPYKAKSIFKLSHKSKHIYPMATFAVFYKLFSVTKPTKIQFAVTAETLHSSRTSSFIIYGCVSKNLSICFQRMVGLSIFSSLVLIASMSDALMSENMNSMNTVDSPASLEVWMAA